MTLRTEQPDLFTPPRKAPRRRRKPMASTSLDAKATLGAHISALEQRILEAVRRVGAVGLTRQEIAERLALGINVVCGRVDHLLEQQRQLVFEPLRLKILHEVPDTRGRFPKGLYQQRDGRKFLVAWEYLPHYPETADYLARRKVA